MKILTIKLYLYIIIFILNILIFGCSKIEPTVNNIEDIPEEISSNFAFSQSNSRLYYSSNKKDLFHIYELDLNNQLNESKKLPITIDQDVFVRSVSQEGKYISFVSDQNGNQIYDVYLYTIENRKTLNLTKSHDIDDGSPMFSPKGNILAFLSSGNLRLFDVELKKFLHLSERDFKSFGWGENGDIIFLEGHDSGIWMMDLNRFKYTKIWSSPSESYVPKMFSNKNEKLLFISDHSGLSNIYTLDIFSREIKDSLSLERDLYSPDLKSHSTVEFRMNTNGSILNYSVNSSGVVHKITSQESGVSYQFYSNDSVQLNLFAGEESPKNFLIGGESYQGASKKDLPQLNSDTKIQSFKDEKGVFHYLFLPENQKKKGWIIWLHGGPHEQISPRYNVFMNYINRVGWGVIALNYRGSTGMGNDYEMRNIMDPSLRLELQIADIKKTVDSVKKKLEINDDKFVILGVSYGAKLAHCYLSEYPDFVSKVIDFSGLPFLYDSTNYSFHEKEFLFISGENDFAFNVSKATMIENYQQQSNVELLILKNEGHYIRRKKNIIKSINKIVEFLEK